MTNNTRNQSLLNDENYDFFKEAVLSALTVILLCIIRITPLILEKSRAIIEENILSLMKSYHSESMKAKIYCILN